MIVRLGLSHYKLEILGNGLLARKAQFPRDTTSEMIRCATPSRVFGITWERRAAITPPYAPSLYSSESKTSWVKLGGSNFYIQDLIRARLLRAGAAGSCWGCRCVMQLREFAAGEPAGLVCNGDTYGCMLLGLIRSQKTGKRTFCGSAVLTAQKFVCLYRLSTYTGKRIVIIWKGGFNICIDCVRKWSVYTSKLERIPQERKISEDSLP